MDKNKNKIKFIDVLPTNDTITFKQFLPELFQEIENVVIGVISTEFFISHFSDDAGCKSKQTEIEANPVSEEL